MRSYGPATTAAKPAAPRPAPAAPAPQEPQEPKAAKKKKKRRKRSAARMVAPPLMIIAGCVALAIYIVSFWFVTGTAMGDTVSPGDVLVVLRTDFSRLSRGDVIAYDLEGKGMVKRVIATSTQTVDVAADGTVTVDGKAVDEAYLGGQPLDRGRCDVEFPYVVPAGRVFVMGDDRAESIDSRALSAGCVARAQVSGKVALRIWPLSSIGPVG